jgi:hypothetical protein
MFRITDTLATHGLGESTYPANKLEQGELANTGFWIVDVRDIVEPQQPPQQQENTDLA